MAKRHQNSSTHSTGSGRAGSSSRPVPARRASAGARAKSRENPKSRIHLPELITVAFAENIEQAKEYETLLAANGIPATIKEQGGESEDTDGIAVMVPEDYLDEAHVVIESQDAYDDFYDFALEDEDEDEGEDESDFDSELFEDDF